MGRKKKQVEPEELSPAYLTTDKHNRFNERGEEVLNPTVMAPPVGYKKQESMFDIVREQIRRSKVDRFLEDKEPESEEEADDFEIEDDPVLPGTRWENDMVPSIKQTRAAMRELQELEKKYAAVVEKPAEEPPAETTPPKE